MYRYTHGDPEHQPDWWIGQLHKSLFDEDELGGLPVTMGFYAVAGETPTDRLRAECLAFLDQFADVRIRLRTLQWL